MLAGEPDNPLEAYFLSGLEFLSQGIRALIRLRDSMGPGQAQQKQLVSTALETFKKSIAEFNQYLEAQAEVPDRGQEMLEVQRLLDDYRKELDMVRRKNKELREIVATKIDSHDSYYRTNYRGQEHDAKSMLEVNRLAKSRGTEQGFEDLTFGRKNKPMRSPPVADEMFKSGHTYSRAGHQDDSVAEKHNRSYVSMQMERPIDSSPKQYNFKRDRTHNSAGRSNSKNQTVDEFGRQSNLKSSSMIDTRGLEQAKLLEQEIASLDHKILGIISEVYDKYNSSAEKDDSAMHEF